MPEHGDVAYFWPFGRLGLATYFLAIGFLLMSALSLQMFAKVRTLIRQWNAHLIFHLGLGVLCVARCVAFGVLTAFSFVSVKNNDALYPLYIMLFTLPEFVCLIIYSLLFFNWMEIFIFSHDQFHFDFASFHRKWARVFSVVSAIVLVGQGTLYAMLYLGADALSENNITAILTWTVAILSLALPFCFLLAFFYFATVALSGFPYLSALAHARVSKINLVFVVWTVGRLVRGTLLMLSLRFDWESSLPEAYLAALIVAILVVVEIIPFYLSLDWSTVAILITDMNDERRQQLLNAPHGIMFSPDASAHDAHEQRDPEVRRLFLDPNSVVPVGDADEGGEGDLDDGAAADSASSSSSVLFHARHTASGGGGAVAIVVRKFQLHELDSASMCDEYAQDLALWSNVDHPHVARFVGVYRIGLSVYSCTEAHGVPLDRLIARAPKQPMPAPKLIRLAKQVCRALSFLQLRRRTQGASGGSGGNSIGVGHGQLSSSSVVIDSTGTIARIDDIGASRLSACAELALLQRAHSGFTAPEVLCGVATELALATADVFSFGMVLHHAVFRARPHAGKTLAALRQLAAQPPVAATANARAPAVSALRLPLAPVPLGYEAHAPLLQLIERCWAAEPSARPTFQQLYGALDDMEVL